jgi:hypothetical protein
VSCPLARSANHLGQQLLGHFRHNRFELLMLAEMSEPHEHARQSLLAGIKRWSIKSSSSLGQPGLPSSIESTVNNFGPYERQRNDRIEKTCQHSAMEHPKQNKRPSQTHPSALAVPSYHRILVKHGLIEKTLSIPDAYEVFLKVGADPEVQKLRRKVARGNKMKHVPALYLATAMALQGMTKQEIEALKLRIEEKRV